jgi:hypothetical protein
MRTVIVIGKEFGVLFASFITYLYVADNTLDIYKSILYTLSVLGKNLLRIASALYLLVIAEILFVIFSLPFH